MRFLDRWMSFVHNVVHNFLNIPCENLSSMINVYRWVNDQQQIHREYKNEKRKNLSSIPHSFPQTSEIHLSPPIRSLNFAFQSANNARHRRHRSMHIDVGSINIYIFVAREISIHARRFNPLPRISLQSIPVPPQSSPSSPPPFSPLRNDFHSLLPSFFHPSVPTKISRILRFIGSFPSIANLPLLFYSADRSRFYHKYRGVRLLNRLLRVDWTTARQEAG